MIYFESISVHCFFSPVLTLTLSPNDCTTKFLMPLTGFVCILGIQYKLNFVCHVSDENRPLLRVFIRQPDQSHKHSSLLFIYFNAFSLSRRILLKCIEGHLKGHGSKNWAYIFNANPVDGALVSPNWDHLVARWPGLTCCRSIFPDLIIMMVGHSSFSHWLVIQKVNVLH